MKEIKCKEGEAIYTLKPEEKSLPSDYVNTIFHVWYHFREEHSDVSEEHVSLLLLGQSQVVAGLILPTGHHLCL